MKKIHNKTLITLAMLSCSMIVNAFDFKFNGVPYNILTENTCEIIGDVPVPESGKFVIPSTVEFDGVTYTVTTIGEDAFSWRSDVFSVSIPNTVTTIKKDAFMYCEKLTSIDIPNSVTTIGEAAFCGCQFTTVTIPESVTTLEYEAFGLCESLTSVTIPSSITKISKRAFYCCKSLNSITIPTSITSIDYEAFKECRSLKTLTIPGNVKTIGEGAFQSSGLVSVSLSEGVTTIGKVAFEMCDSLASVSIPASVTSIGDEAFAWNYKLKDFYDKSTTPQELGLASFMSINTNSVLHVPAGCKSVYEEAGWKGFRYFYDIVEDGGEQLGIESASVNDKKYSSKKYSISGQQLYSAKKGVNIVNGKKYSMK